MLNLLKEKLIRIDAEDGARRKVSLPEVFAELDADRVAAFPALRPHQRHVWHAFLVQLAVLALGPGTDEGDWPADAQAWRERLRALTPDFPGDEPWSLVVEDLSKPAFLQPPVPEGTLADFRNVFRSPDALDMLVTAKNHDVKRAVMTEAQTDDWLFALLSLQTQEGYSGAKQYGISRMNSAYGSRPGLDVALPGGPGMRWKRDVKRLRRALAEHLEDPRLEWEGYDPGAGLGLVWLEKWDGTGPLDRTKLHPLYIEICRRVRLVWERGAIVARQTGTKTARIVAPEGGATGDPWTPTATKDGKVLTVPAGGFHYRRMSELLFDEKTWGLPLLARAARDERGPLTLIARALTRGQGKTEGYHERLVPIPAPIVGRLFGGGEEKKDLADLARTRIEAIAELQSALTDAARVLVQGGPQKVSNNAPRNAFVEGLRPRLEAFADATFFEDLWAEAEAEPDAAVAAREAWLERLYRFGRDLLDEAGESLPLPAQRRLRARVEAERAFNRTIARKSQWKDFLSNSRARRRASEASEDAA